MVKNPPANAGDVGWEEPLEEVPTTHSSILAWRIPWIEEPNGLQSTELQRLRRDWAHSDRSPIFLGMVLKVCVMFKLRLKQLSTQTQGP